ncbi:MAG: WavE lipopolysaccharide synthesis family protein [Planctomycetales bacterium]
MAIRPADVSVVVQGPITGSANDPARQRLTHRCLESIRHHLPESEIILSTWIGSDVSGLSFDVLVENEDPGATPVYIEFQQVNNMNRQIVSTRSGLQQVSRPLVLKFRTDLELLGTNVLGLFRKYTARCDEWKIFKDRIVSSTLYAMNPRRFVPLAFHPSDWCFFGNREDVIHLWDLPLQPEPETSQWFSCPPGVDLPWLRKRTCRYAPEQYLWTSCLGKHGQIDFDHFADIRSDNIGLSELTIANNLALVSLRQWQVRYLKGKRGTWRDINLFSVYTHGEWLSLYKKYCDPAARVPLCDPRSWLNRLFYFFYFPKPTLGNTTPRDGAQSAAAIRCRETVDS